MAKAVHGDPSIDKENKKRDDENRAFYSKKTIKNLSLKESKRTSNTLKKIIADIDSGIVDKIQQSIGGVKSTRPTKKRS